MRVSCCIIDLPGARELLLLVWIKLHGHTHSLDRCDLDERSNGAAYDRIWMIQSDLNTTRSVITLYFMKHAICMKYAICEVKTTVIIITHKSIWKYCCAYFGEKWPCYNDIVWWFDVIWNTFLIIHLCRFLWDNILNAFPAYVLASISYQVLWNVLKWEKKNSK